MKVNEKRREKKRRQTQNTHGAGTNQMNQKFPRVTMEIINQKIEKKPTKIKEEKNKKEEREKFEINLQIQPFDFEKSCAKYQNIFGYIKKSIPKLFTSSSSSCFASLFVGRDRF